MHKIFIFAVILLFMACNSSRLEMPFDIKRYDFDTQILLKEKAVNLGEFFLINYAIQRQRDYYNYSVDGKTFGEILAMAQQFKSEGLPVEQVFNQNGKTANLEVVVESEGHGLVRKKERQKTLLKALNFYGKYKNTGKQNLVLHNSTFQFFGPLQDHLTSASYEMNCLIKPGEEISVNFFLDAKDLKDNVLSGSNYDIKKVWIDSLIANTQIVLAGNTISENPKAGSVCKHGGTRVNPVKVFSYADFKNGDWQERDAEGKTTKLLLGDAHFLPEEKILEYR